MTKHYRNIVELSQISSFIYTSFFVHCDCFKFSYL